MPKSKNYGLFDKMICILAESDDLNIRQVAHRVGGKYSSTYEYLEILREHGFVVRRDFITEKGTRPYVIVELGLLGYLYATYMYNIRKLTLSEKRRDKIVEKAYYGLLKFLNEKLQTLQEIFENDPWNKLCFNAFCLIKERGMPPKIIMEVISVVAHKIFDRYMGAERALVPECLGKLFVDEAEICETILEGLKDSHRNIFMYGSSIEAKDYLETFGLAFNALAEEEKKDVMAGFRYEYNSLIKTLLKDLPKKVRNRFHKMMSEAELNQIVCLFHCPKCGYRGPSMQYIERVLASYTVQCEKCKRTFDLAYLSKYFDKRMIKGFGKWSEGVILKHMRPSLTKAYEEANSEQKDESHES